MCDLNLAAVALKVKGFAEAKIRCLRVLEQERASVAVLFCPARAEVGLEVCISTIANCRAMYEVGLGNGRVRVLNQAARALLGGRNPEGPPA